MGSDGRPADRSAAGWRKRLQNSSVCCSLKETLSGEKSLVLTFIQEFTDPGQLFPAVAVQTFTRRGNMEIGWIDFSDKETTLIQSILKLLKKQTVDELGIAPIRDGFSEIFFPGVSTLQTRAKYFFIIPYLLKDLEQNCRHIIKWKELAKKLDEGEMQCAKILQKKEDATGIIGARSLDRGRWVSVSPSRIYWSGLRKFRFFSIDAGLNEYLRALCENNRLRNNLAESGNFDEEDGDDADAGLHPGKPFLDLPTYEKDWKKNLELTLSAEEGAFLKEKILDACPESLLGCLLRLKLREVEYCENFDSLERLTGSLPEGLQRDLRLARNFLHFYQVLNILYNCLLKNSKAEEKFRNIEPKMKGIAGETDLEAIFQRLPETNKPPLPNFLRAMRDKMLIGDVEGLKEGILSREKYLKGPARARTLNPQAVEKDKWYGGYLNYRFSKGLELVREILAASEVSA